MFVKVIELAGLEFRKVKFYTIQIEDRENSEFKDFVIRMKVSHMAQLGELLQLIKDIGNEYGAQKEKFRHERTAEALPPPNHYYLNIDEEQNQYGLRLYCIRVTDEIVILLNGDLKTSQWPDQCPNCNTHFSLANRISPKITEAIFNEDLTPINKILLGTKEFEFEI